MIYKAVLNSGMNFVVVYFKIRHSKYLKIMKRYLLILTLFVFQFNFGQTKTWDGSSSTNWNTAANWTPSGVPTASDDVVIPNSNGTNANPIISNNSFCKSIVEGRF